MPALESIEVEGYKSIRSARVDLGVINVLIGANGSGKSNLLGVFGLLADLADHRLPFHIAREGGADAILHLGRKRTSTLRIELHFTSSTYEAVLVPAAGDTLVFGPDAPSAWDPILTTMRAGRPFHLHHIGRGAPTNQRHEIDDNRFLRPEGDNLAPYLLALRSAAPGAYRRIVEAVRSIAPFFDDFEVVADQTNPDVIQLAWRHASNDALFTADSLSNGTLRFICLATLLLQPTLPPLIVVDEPELGLHPFAIVQLAALIRAAATRTQVILATQSVTLLDQFDTGEVIVAERANGESSFRRLDEATLVKWKQDDSLGELWLKNVLGGRPR